ncbi:SAM-dependent methyltransferase [Bradyrhizobium sp. Tv2a-2]|uniref:Eco57I restriction-modification methylase domain-containing protein n=1 Tax=Bradyrhizobium sp. Tv2a-2 TaxID=113395 RepID=UPI0004171245|nr:SAM-dependent methyltransferase [Bradyrhizobium sp. Tv2a-2]
MATALDREIRKLLDKAVRKARFVAEDGARKALTELGVEDARKPDGLSRERADLRSRLRAHAQSLGDVKAPNDSIRASRLVREIAYEHWHRALFARLLAENNLLTDPDHKVAVSLSDLEEIAREEGRDLVELAADWAEPMLPQIFRKDDPILALTLPPETKAGITDIVKELPRAVFAADDSLGWAYQFWQADQKDRINESEVKIGADELPAVTQLFTEDYMVLFLLENTLGAWWAGKVLVADPALAAGAETEEDLRQKTSPPGYRWTYLRFVREPYQDETHETATGPWRPAAGAFDGWPKAARDVTILDPCMGSGHFLVFALSILIAFRCAEEGLDERAAVRAVLAENLFGLEIDPRCTQIAAFALALASWKRLGGPEQLPQLNLACSGLAIGLGKAAFLDLAEKIADAEGWTGKTDPLGTDRTPLGATASAAHRGELAALYHLFEQAPQLGSLIDPRRTLEQAFGPLYATGIDKLGTVLDRLLEAGAATATAEVHEIAVTAHGIAKAAELLGRRYTLAATNVPYLGNGKFSRELKEYIERTFEEARADIANVFVLRLLALCSEGGSYGVVTPQNWLAQVTFKDFRVSLLCTSTINFLALLDKNAFQDMNWWAAITLLTVGSNIAPTAKAHYSGLNLAGQHLPSEKAAELPNIELVTVAQASQLTNPDSMIGLEDLTGRTRLSKYADCYQGISPGDSARTVFCFWEYGSLRKGWEFIQYPPHETTEYAGCHYVLRWSLLQGGFESAAVRGEAAWGQRGLAFGQMNNLPLTIFGGTKFSNSSPVVVPKEASNLEALYAFFVSPQFRTELRKINAKTSVDNGYFGKIPFDLTHWKEVAAVELPKGLPKPRSNDPTQWYFDGHPRGSADPNVSRSGATNPRLVTPYGVRPGMAEHPLQVVVARLLNYRWPRQTGSSFMDCPAAPAPDEVDRSGVIDTDGIVPLAALGGEADAATRLRDLIRAVWGPDYAEDTIRELLTAEAAKATDLGTWLADEFFEGHCKLFHQTPFVWHIWDGVRGGFSALVNYHRLCEANGAGRRLLEKLRDSYLGEWIAAQRRALAAGEAGAEDRLLAAEHLRGELTKIIEGDPPYDIFVRWKPLHRQSIGWEPDIDDGIRLNIRPFLTAKPKNSARRDGCILRVTPRVKKHAGADRGAEPKLEKGDFPWFWAEDHDVDTTDFAGGPQFKGRRYNDLHYTRAFKQSARETKAGAVSGALSEPVLEDQGRTS